MDIRLFELRTEKRGGSEKLLHQVYYANMPMGLQLVAKKQGDGFHGELGFDFQYHIGSWILKKPFVMWTGNTYQEPYNMQLGSPRMGQECINMGRVKTMRELEINIFEWMESTDGKAILLKQFNTKIQIQYNDLQVTSATVKVLAKHLGLKV